MGNGIIAIITGIAASAWLYGKFQASTGFDAKNTIIGTIVSGIMVAFVVYIILGFIE
jgi:hypothetical protein